MGEANALTPEQIERIKERSSDGGLDCAETFKLAEELGIPRPRMAKALDELGIRLRNCQLGCF